MGGKLLTNYLKELVSYRQYNMMDEFLLMNDVKEALCFVSDNLIKDLQRANSLTAHTSKFQRGLLLQDPAGNALRQFYVLPDGQHVLKGFVKDSNSMDVGMGKEQLLMMETERIAVPELLFHPCDVSIEEGGVVHCAQQSLQALSIVSRLSRLISDNHHHYYAMLYCD